MSLKTAGVLMLALAGIAGLGFWMEHGAGGAEPDQGSLSWEQARLFAEVMERVKEDYVQPVDDAELLESAIRGMVSGLDPHSEFLDEDEYREIRISTSGRYSGVGIEVTAEDSELRVVAPIDDTPAQRAG